MIECWRGFGYSAAMTFSVSLFRNALLLLCGLALSGCLPSGQSQMDEEKDPHFLEGKRCVNEMDYKGAIERFERALEANPKSGSAHFELGWLFEKTETDPAAAGYHYNSYLRLRPNAENAEIVKQHIVACKQELAKTVSLGPVTEKQQREFEQMAEDNKRLHEVLEENKQLHEALDRLRASVPARPPVQNNQSAPTPVVVRVMAPANSNQPASAVPPASTVSSGVRTNVSAMARTHTIKSGDTLAGIARRYGVKLDSLMAANPRVDARHLLPGQTLSIPGS